MNAYGYYQEMTGEETETAPQAAKISEAHTPELQAIIKAKLPRFVANIRQLPRKEQSAKVRQLFKSMGLKGISVTTPSYSMASDIHISLPRQSWEAHEPVHTLAEIESRKDDGPYMGLVHYCAFCKESRDAHNAIEKIVLAAFPDMDDRGIPEEDYFDHAFSVNS